MYKNCGIKTFKYLSYITLNYVRKVSYLNIISNIYYLFIQVL